MSVGFVGPYGQRIRVLFDTTAAEMEEAIVGANERDYHFRHVVPERDLTVSQVGDFRNVQEGEACPRSRVLSAVIEQNHDEHGIIWPVSLAPYQVHLVPVSVKDEAGRQLAEAIYERLCGLGVEVLLDDRDERVGVKFKDADLIGLPVRIVVGKEAGEGRVEFVERRFPGVKTSLTVEEVVRRVLEMRSAP